MKAEELKAKLMSIPSVYTKMSSLQKMVLFVIVVYFYNTLKKSKRFDKKTIFNIETWGTALASVITVKNAVILGCIYWVFFDNLELLNVESKKAE